MLDAQGFSLLESTVLKRLEKASSEDKLNEAIIKMVVRTTVITLQEYEKLSQAQDS